MAPLPKKRMSSGRKGNRRRELRASVPSLVGCPQCRLPKLAHRACPSCGYYNGRLAVVVETERRPSA